MTHAREAIRDGLDEVRAITRFLAPKPATFLSLTSEIRREMADACVAAQLDLEGDAESDGATVAAAMAHMLRRIAREALTNAIKHANARRIVCRVAATKESFTLRVEDEGRGFSDARSEGQGLGIMARRVARACGIVEHGNRVEGAASGGAYVAVRLPRMSRGR